MGFAGFARNCASAVIHRVGPCDELGLNRWDRAGFHGGMVIMVGGLVDLHKNPC